MHVTSRQLIAWGMILGALLIVGGALFYFWPVERGVSLPSESERLAARVAKEQAVAALIASKDITRCEEVKGVSSDGINYYAVCRNNILYQTISENPDFSQCDAVDGTLFTKTECEERVLSARISLGKEGVELCDTAPAPSRETCRLSYWQTQALKTGTTAPCGNLSGTDTTYCREKVLLRLLRDNPKTESCTQFDPSDQAACSQVKQAVTSKKITECQKITRPDFRQVCIDIFLLKKI
ncbi:MAG: hypothetical protein AAB691_03260 [Patescibacteria group bacterium]